MKRPRCAHCGRRVAWRNRAMIQIADGPVMSWHYNRRACRQAWIDAAGRLTAQAK